MKLLYTLFLIFATYFSMQAQFELSKKKKITIKAMPQKFEKKKAKVETPKPTTDVDAQIKFESKYLKNPDEEYKKYMNTPQVAIRPDNTPNEVRNPSEIYTEKMNKKQDGTTGERFKSDTFLGEFKTGSRTVRMACRDHEAPDGDLVRIWVNDRVVVEQILLDVEYKEVFLELKDGFNKVEIEALNQGESGPNTAQFVVFDSKSNLVTSNKWNLATGVKAKIILLKENLEK